MVPPGSCASVNASLNVDYLCANQSSSVLDEHDLRGRLQRHADWHTRERAAAATRATPQDTWRRALDEPHLAHHKDFSTGLTYLVVFVATNGSDSTGNGSMLAPFATLAHAAAYIRSQGPRVLFSTGVYIRAGTYYMGGAPLVLTAADSNVTWTKWPLDAAPVVLSGGVLLPPLAWTPYTGGVPGILMAPVSIPDTRRDAWFASHPGVRGRLAGPPPLVASLFVDGVRQVRARYPNGNPQDNSGLCFSATQRPGEGCAGWSACAISSGGVQPAPSGVSVATGPDRGSSPVYGCDQCHHFGTFQYTIYPPPPDHPVYNAPLPGVGWSNTSVFSFWGSPFARPASVVVNAESCDPHWKNASYAKASDAVVHMFHQGLWGGWMFAVNNITHQNVSVALPPAQPATTLNARAIPPGAALWLRADDISPSQNGLPVSQWKDASGSGNDALQPNASVRPVYYANGFGGNGPAVRFSGAQLLEGSALRLPSECTIFAVVYDNGTQTQYGSGVFFSPGSFVGLGTRAAANQGPNTQDDDPSPIGSDIIAVMMDWAGSPANPGHRDLLHRPTEISIVFDQYLTSAYVDGCLELEDVPRDASGSGFMIGARNNELGRFLIGDIAEVIVYPRALNSTERSAVDAYLQSKWQLKPRKDCSQPIASTLVMNFGYGGYQEARGSGVGAGQHFYLENVLEELDVPGEWYYDADTSTLYVYPNVTDIASSQLVVPNSDSIIIINGSASDGYATGITLANLTLTQSRVTFLEMYEVPSGGDWSVHRGGAMYIQDAENITVLACTFDQVGGNGIILSNHVTGTDIVDVEIRLAGDSGIILLGSTNGIDGSAPTYPNGNTISGAYIHDIGVYGKQVSCIGQQLSANTTIVNNLCANGPRAGINFNDGFGGNHVMFGNVVWNAVRETGDHGPFNSWDRQPYWTLNGNVDGFNDPQGRSIIKVWDTLSKNLMLNGYNGVWTYDHDDGSQFFVDDSSFMWAGGCKNFIGNHKACQNNVILYPGMDGRSAGNRRCQTDDSGEFAESFYTNNTCTSVDGSMYSFSDCQFDPSNLNTTVYYTAANTHMVDAGAQFSQTCGQTASFAAWQAYGQDIGSKTAATPSIATLISLGAAALGV